MAEEIGIQALMEGSGVKFGTSGARGLVRAMTDRVCFAYTAAFLEHLANNRGLLPGTTVCIGGDRRPSTPRVMQAVARACVEAGYRVENCGLVPSPAVALRGLDASAPAIMVTGSHIPDDRNGIKFNTPLGEVTKEDEQAMRALRIEVPDLFDREGMLSEVRDCLGPENIAALVAYRSRYLKAFDAKCLSGTRLGVYGHSAVGRDLLVELYETLGAEVVPLGFSESFIPVDTEAIRSEDVALAQKWAQETAFDAIVSTDGDSDRPLIADETGAWVRGDIAGIVTARFLGADAVATPVSCNSAVETCGSFAHVARSRIGSPFVIEKMNQAVAEGYRGVVGYEANGGFLTANELDVPGGGVLPPLPTRDAVIVHLALVQSAKLENKTLSRLVSEVAPRKTASDRDQSFATEESEEVLKYLASATSEQVAGDFGLGALVRRDSTDGLRMTFENGEIVHLRPSGNAPELRCYSEADDEDRASVLVAHGLSVARKLAASRRGHS